MSISIPRDVQEFLDGYPNSVSNPEYTANLGFYTNKRRCRPDCMLIDDLHEEWLGHYDKLEYKHGFIQWLFPIKEFGMNYESQPLQEHELQAMKSDPEVIQRLIKSYKLMLDFYGMRLVEEETGQVDRSLPPRNAEARYSNLVSSSHNNLRISRILKCLSEFGLEKLNAGFLLHVLNEQSEGKQLSSIGLKASMDKWWANCIRNEDERAWIGDVIVKVRKGELEFTRTMYLEALQRRKETGHLAESKSQENGEA